MGSGGAGLGGETQTSSSISKPVESEALLFAFLLFLFFLADLDSTLGTKNDVH